MLCRIRLDGQGDFKIVLECLYKHITEVKPAVSYTIAGRWGKDKGGHQGVRVVRQTAIRYPIGCLAQNGASLAITPDTCDPCG